VGYAIGQRAGIADEECFQPGLFEDLRLFYAGDNAHHLSVKAPFEIGDHVLLKGGRIGGGRVACRCQERSFGELLLPPAVAKQRPEFA